PGSPFIIGITNQDIKASEEIWRFFRKYKLDGLTNATQIEPAAKWTIFPNPATDYLILQSNLQTPIQFIKVWNATGQLEQVIKPEGTNSIRIETGAWTKGLYFLTIEQTGKPECLRVLKI